MQSTFRTKAEIAFTGLLFLTTTATSCFADYNSQCTQAAIAASDQVKSYCAQAGSAKTTAQYQTTKAVVETAATAYLVAAGFLPAMQPACTAVTRVAVGAGIAIDIAGAVQSKDYTTALVSAGTSVATMTIGSGITKAVASKAEDLVDKLSSGVRSEATKTKATGCLQGAVSTGISAAMAAAAAATAKKAENSALGSASSLVAAETSNGFTVGTGTGTTTGNTGSSGAAGAATAATVDCSSKTGTAYLTCTGGAESAALTNPDAVSAIESNLKGTTLGDLAKNYTGDGSPASLASYVGGAMGMNSDGQDSLASALKKAGALAGTNDEAYNAAKYVSNGGKVDTGNGEVDFNKMMSSMLGKLNPDAADKKNADASSAVFRQLDLLSPDKITSNKDISLFARVGYRYRKKSSDVDQLNWAAPSNATTTSSTTTTTTRNPASKN